MRTSGVILSAIILLSGLAAHASALRTEGTAIVPVSAQASSTQTASKAVENLINGNGLSETAPGSRAWVHTASAFRDRGVERGTMWSSGNAGGQVERTPTLTFDLGRELALGGFRVWNYNETHWTGMGFKEVEVSASLDGKLFTPLGTAIFRQAPGEGDYEGQFVSFKSPTQARYVRLHCLSNWQGYDRAGLAEIRFYPGGAGQECPGYESYALRNWTELAKVCREYLGFDPTTWERYRAAVYFQKRITQPDGNLRRMLPIGDTHPSRSGGPAIVEVALEEVRKFKSGELPGFGAIFTSNPGTPQETYLSFKSGPNRGHYHGDQLSFHYCANARALAVDHHCSYHPRAGQDHITFSGDQPTAGDSDQAVKVTRAGQAVLSLSGKEIDLNRSQGDIGLFVPDAGYPFGEIPDWLIRQRVTQRRGVGR